MAFTVSNVYANTLEVDAIVRNDRFKARTQKVTLQNLKSQNCFEGKHFRIVKAKNSEPLCLDDIDQDLKLKASTVYYHLEKAREYFSDQLNSEHVKNLPQIIIRLEMKNHFHHLGHFGNDNLPAQYNNAVSVPAGRGLPSRGINPWDEEIWFRPAKRIHISEIDIRGNFNSVRGMLSEFRGQTHILSLQQFLLSLGIGQAPAVSLLDPSNVFRVAGASLVMELAYWGGPSLARLFQRKWYHLETSLVPEIIYHEFAHIALNDYLEVTHSTAVIEGMADFFAARIANSDKLATNIKKYNTFNGKKASNTNQYRQIFETTGYANTDFVFGLLWGLEDVMEKKSIDSFIYDLRKGLQTDSSISEDLVWAIVDQCKVQCDNLNVMHHKLMQYFYLRGI